MRMKTVQVAVRDPGYADSIRNLLLEDGSRQVHLVERPDPGLEGVIIADSASLDGFPQSPDEQERLILIVQEERDDLSKIWDAGVRHVVFRNDPPHTARIVVVGVELTLERTRKPACVISLSRR
jgi:hypothetical protein